MLTKKLVIDCVLSGIIESNRFYEEISDGLWLNDSAVESIIQCKLAETLYSSDKKLFKRQGHSIAFEFHISELIKFSREKRLPGKVPKLIDGAKRLDLVVFDENNLPQVIIEIKRNAATDGFGKDAKRIVEILKKSDTKSGGSVKYGIICGFIFGEGISEKDALEDRGNKLLKSFDVVEFSLGGEKYEKFDLFSDAEEFEIDGEEMRWWAGGAVCIYLRR